MIKLQAAIKYGEEEYAGAKVNRITVSVIDGTYVP